MIFRALRAACARSTSVARDTFVPMGERNEGNCPKTRSEGTKPSSPRLSLHAFIARLSRTYFLSLGWSF